MKEIKDRLASNTIRAISLFSGAGGLDIGAIYAGAHILWAKVINAKDDTIDTIKTISREIFK